MPGFSEVKTEGTYVDIEANHFLCECDRIGWYLALVQDNFDADIIRYNQTVDKLMKSKKN